MIRWLINPFYMLLLWRELISCFRWALADCRQLAAGALLGLGAASRLQSAERRRRGAPEHPHRFHSVSPPAARRQAQFGLLFVSWTTSHPLPTGGTHHRGGLEDEPPVCPLREDRLPDGESQLPGQGEHRVYRPTTRDVSGWQDHQHSYHCYRYNYYQTLLNPVKWIIRRSCQVGEVLLFNKYTWWEGFWGHLSPKSMKV